MKQIEIPKNAIIGLLLGLVVVMALYPHFNKIMPPDEDNDTIATIDYVRYLSDSLSGLIDTTQIAYISLDTVIFASTNGIGYFDDGVGRIYSVDDNIIVYQDGEYDTISYTAYSIPALLDSIRTLKKKVGYYFEFYRKNQPVNVEVAYDTISTLSGIWGDANFTFGGDSLTQMIDTSKNEICKERGHVCSGVMSSTAMYCFPYIIESDTATIQVYPACNYITYFCARCGKVITEQEPEGRYVIWRKEK
jgi:hypothetical protein